VAEPFSKNIAELREWDHEVWEKAEGLIPRNSEVFAKIIGIHYDLLVRAHEPHGGRTENGLERALRLMAARCAHILRATWIGSMAGYTGACQPLVRALYETSLTMYYLRTFPAEFETWTKPDKSFPEQKKFWPSSMMKRLKAPEHENVIYSRLAEAAHANPPALSRLAAYDAESDTLEISVGQVTTADEARRLSRDMCLFGVLSAYNVARTVKHALVDGLPTHDQLQQFLVRLDDLMKSADRPPSAGSTTVFDMLAERAEK
jgi:hypothetical protein